MDGIFVHLVSDCKELHQPSGHSQAACAAPSNSWWPLSISRWLHRSSGGRHLSLYHSLTHTNCKHSLTCLWSFAKKSRLIYKQEGYYWVAIRISQSAPLQRTVMRPFATSGCHLLYSGYNFAAKIYSCSNYGTIRQWISEFLLHNNEVLAGVWISVVHVNFWVCRLQQICDFWQFITINCCE